MEKEYIKLLKFVCEFGFGAFCVPMLENKNEVKSFEKWIRTNKKYYDQISGNYNSRKTSIKVLNKLGFLYLNISPRKLNINHESSLLDILVINSYLWQNKIFQEYDYNPSNKLKILNNKKVALISKNWGIPKDIEKADIIITSKSKYNSILENKIEYAEKYKIDYKLIDEILGKIEIPKAVLKA